MHRLPKSMGSFFSAWAETAQEPHFGRERFFWCPYRMGNRGEVIGIVKPELLPDEAKLHLSQIRPPGAKDLNLCVPEYSGYSFLPDGRYASGVWLAGPEEVKGYVEMQKDYQHRVLICDRDDFAVLEIVEGKLVFPDEQALQEFYKEHQSDGGMTMV